MKQRRIFRIVLLIIASVIIASGAPRDSGYDDTQAWGFPIIYKSDQVEPPAIAQVDRRDPKRALWHEFRRDALIADTVIIFVFLGVTLRWPRYMLGAFGISTLSAFFRYHNDCGFLFNLGPGPCGLVSGFPVPFVDFDYLGRRPHLDEIALGLNTFLWFMVVFFIYLVPRVLQRKHTRASKT